MKSASAARGRSFMRPRRTPPRSGCTSSWASPCAAARISSSCAPPMSEPSEFDFLAEAAAELGLDTAAIPPVSREFLALPGGQQISYLQWGTSEQELVLVHGGGQNAHTWDLVLLLLGRPAIAIDLPGHGHSDW